MKTTSLALVLVAAVQLGMVGCDHLRAKDASAEQNAKSSEKPSSSASLVPPSDRYATTGGEQH